jgi:hypothetical protein
MGESGYRWLSGPRIGLMSSIGVPEMASSRSTVRPSGVIAVMVAWWRPIGFGRCGERVANTPVAGRVGSSRGCTMSALRLAR